MTRSLGIFSLSIAVCALAGLLHIPAVFAEEADRFAQWQQQRDEVLRDPDLVAYYDFQEGGGDVLHNKAGINPELHGKIRGATWAEGRWPGKKALLFDGKSSHVEIPHSSSLILLDKAKGGRGEVSVVVSFMPLTVNECGIVDKQSTGWGKEAPYGIWISPKAAFAVTADGATGQAVRDRTDFVAGNWYHIVFTADEKRLTLYKNGLLVDQQRLSLSPYDNGRPLLFGCMVPGKFQFHGLIDEVAIYKRALNKGEVVGQSKTKPVVTFYIP
ncbi:MAG: hypothetical protein AUJ92_01985 [Armatimonadetes bacterium CG2_30_59_28]|nr:LamG domain-containing protein [Armatimonadota bacterium]OIO98156.1 MAG: hypothetical protein AUJ92_01985 [Armatimonadetes bacterium CG2_30_59_28]PIU66179.1 MAG: hypothetical protein COS85_05770 [Armatimonadetes bacterium CG07_land_8_20_14_0_80_59_28]PIY47502.1 MAG: hypothetical protein COZ05_04855 [Armatimonadetes bacterium CG_4_10_14_3_um_filter_59_10]